MANWRSHFHISFSRLFLKGGLLVLLSLLLILGWALPNFVRIDTFRPQITAALEELSDRHWVIGHLYPQILPLPGVIATDVVVFDPHFPTDPVIRVGKMRVLFYPRPLRHLELRPEEIVLDSPRIFIHRRDKDWSRVWPSFLSSEFKSPKSTGPRLHLIREMDRDNPTWGEERIADELLLKLGIRVSPRTVRKYLDMDRPRGRGTSQRWSTFVRNHAKVIVACDFFVSVTASFRVLYVFVAMEIGSRRILHCNVTEHPTAEWTIQQFREFLAFDHPYRFVIHDRDSIFSPRLDQELKGFGVRVLKTPVRAPQAKDYASHCTSWVPCAMTWFDEAAFGQLHALRFSRRVIAGMLKQTVVLVVVGVTAKQPVTIPYLDAIVA